MARQSAYRHVGRPRACEQCQAGSQPRRRVRSRALPLSKPISSPFGYGAICAGISIMGFLHSLGYPQRASWSPNCGAGALKGSAGHHLGGLAVAENPAARIPRGPVFLQNRHFKYSQAYSTFASLFGASKEPLPP
jgi:hypothetical protein